MTWDLFCSVCTGMTGKDQNYGCDDCRQNAADAVFFFFVRGLETLSAIYNGDSI